MASVRVFRGVVCHRQFASSRLGSKIAISQKQRSHKGLSTFAVAKDVIPEGRAAPAYTPELEKLLDGFKWDSNGLVVAIAQNVDTGAVMMQGFANRDAVSATLASGKATFYSRSRKCLWTKGETSSNFIQVVDVYLDCDKDSVIYLGVPDGPTCHTGAETCYYSKLDPESSQLLEGGSGAQALTTLFSLEDTLNSRKAEVDLEASGVVQAGKKSWTKKLLTDSELLCSKIREEAGELCQTLEENEGKERAASEMADLLYHSMVLLTKQGVKLEEVAAVLRKRFAQSGIDEKASRKLKRDT